MGQARPPLIVFARPNHCRQKAAVDSPPLPFFINSFNNAFMRNSVASCACGSSTEQFVITSGSDSKSNNCTSFSAQNLRQRFWRVLDRSGQSNGQTCKRAVAGECHETSLAQVGLQLGQRNRRAAHHSAAASQTSRAKRRLDSLRLSNTIEQHPRANRMTWTARLRQHWRKNHDLAILARPPLAGFSQTRPFPPRHGRQKIKMTRQHVAPTARIVRISVRQPAELLSFARGGKRPFAAQPAGVCLPFPHDRQ